MAVPCLDLYVEVGSCRPCHEYLAEAFIFKDSRRSRHGTEGRSNGHATSAVSISIQHTWKEKRKRYCVDIRRRKGRLNISCSDVLHLRDRLGIQVDCNTLGFLLQECVNSASVSEGRRVHAHIIKGGFEGDIFVGNQVANMYAKCDCINDARQMFDKMRERNLVSWNAMIAGYARNGQVEKALNLFYEMHLAGMKPDKFSFSTILMTCGNAKVVRKGRQIHACVIKTGFEAYVFVGSALVDMYAKCQSIDDAHQVFDKMPERNLVSWTAMVSAYAQSGYSEKALNSFYEMHWAGVKTNNFTFTGALSACAALEALEQGKQIHAQIIMRNFSSNLFVVSALIAMYAKCGAIENARELFEKMHERDAVSWTTMITAYAQNEKGKDALKLFFQMQHSRIKPTLFILASVLKACASLAYLEHGKQVHAYILKNGFESDDFVGGSIVDMYAKCGRLEVALNVFDKMPARNIFSWTAIIADYTQSGQGEEAPELFRQMLHSGISSDQFIYPRILCSCANRAALEQGKQVHAHVIRNGFESYTPVGNALVTMYAKCGSIVDAHRGFSEMPERDTVSWTAMIAGNAQHGLGKEALECFEQMQLAGVKPNHVTFVGVLSACSYVGLVDAGHWYFESMTRDHGIMPTVEHYACMVDLLARAGQLDEAEGFIHGMPFAPDSLVWRTLLGACRVYGNMELAKRAAECLIELEPHDSSAHVLLANMYAAAGRWHESTMMKKLMKTMGMKRERGHSWIEVKNRVHTFVARDRSHPEMKKIYAKLEELSGKLEEAGYLPDTNVVLHDVDEETNEESFSHQ